MRAGSVYRRCRSCTWPVAGRRCAKCGSDRIVWAFAVDVQERGMPRHQRKRSGFATKGEAVAAMRALQEAAEAGRGEPTRMTVGQWLDSWLLSIRDRVRGGTLANYELTVRRHIRPAIGDLPMRHLTRARVRELYASLADSGSARGGGLSPKSVHNMSNHPTLGRTQEAPGRVALQPGRDEYATGWLSAMREFAERVVGEDRDSG